eukprot:13722695-Heterocapsa_arctica.AAC.1
MGDESGPSAYGGRCLGLEGHGQRQGQGRPRSCRQGQGQGQRQDGPESSPMLPLRHPRTPSGDVCEEA